MKIIDVTGETIGCNIPIATPDDSVPHIGKKCTIVDYESLGVNLSSGIELTTPIIRLDDGTIIAGCDCWWGRQLIKNKIIHTLQ